MSIPTPIKQSQTSNFTGLPWNINQRFQPVLRLILSYTKFVLASSYSQCTVTFINHSGRDIWQHALHKLLDDKVPPSPYSLRIATQKPTTPSSSSPFGHGGRWIGCQIRLSSSSTQPESRTRSNPSWALSKRNYDRGYARVHSDGWLWWDLT